MSEPIRVLHVFAALDSGGVANFVMNTYRAIDRSKVQYDFALSSGAKGLMDEEAESLGGRLFYFDNSRGFLENIKSILYKKGPFDVVHSHVFFYSGLVLWEARRAGIPVRIAHAHNAYTGNSRSMGRRAYESIMQWLIKINATHMLGCSKKACQYLFGSNSLRDQRVMVLLDGIDLERFAFDQKIRNTIREACGVENKFVVGHVGHFNAAKNHKKILSVFSEVARNRNDSVLLLVGDGELEETVQNLVRELLLTERVIFAGAHKDVETYYQAMDVFLFPSKYEGFGMAMIEAQANGLSCVASDVVPKETDANGRTIYLPLIESDKEWGKAVMDASKRSTAKPAVEKIYSITATAERLTGIYEQSLRKE